MSASLAAVGCASIAYHAAAWLSALGWETAQGGGFAIARLAAIAPVAFAEHANDAAARAIFGPPVPAQDQMTFITVLAVIALVPLVAYAVGVRKRLGRG